MMGEDRKLGYLVGFDFSGDAPFEIDRFHRKEGREIKPLTVREIWMRKPRAKSKEGLFSIRVSEQRNRQLSIVYQ